MIKEYKDNNINISDFHDLPDPFFIGLPKDAMMTPQLSQKDSKASLNTTEKKKEVKKSKQAPSCSKTKGKATTSYYKSTKKPPQQLMKIDDSKEESVEEDIATQFGGSKPLACHFTYASDSSDNEA